MSWRHWAAVVAVIGLGILLQIPAHEDKGMPGHDHGQGAISPTRNADQDKDTGPYRTVALAVAGMT